MSSSPAAPNKMVIFAPILLDAFAPTLAYYVLHLAGVGEVWALTIGGFAGGINVVAQTVRKRRLDSLGLLVVLMFVVAIVLAIVTGDPRLILAKPALFSALGGLYVLFTVVVGKPLGATTAKPFATRGDSAREAAWNRAWRESPGFRRGVNLLTAVWGVAFLVEAIVRVLIVYSLPIDQSVLLVHVPTVVLVVVCVVVSRLIGRGMLRRTLARYEVAVVTEKNRAEMPE